MAEEETQEQQEQKKKKSPFTKILFILVILGILGGGGFAAYKYFLAETPPAAEEQNATAEDGKGAENSLIKGQLVSLPPFLVNLADPLGRRFLKINMELEMANMQAAEEVQSAMPRIKDSILLLLSSKSYSDLSRMEDKLLLKREIVERVNQIVGPSKVLNVYFTEFVIQ